MVKFHSRVVRVNQMGGKVIVNFKEKLVEEGNNDPLKEIDEVVMFGAAEEAEKAIDTFMEEGR